MSFEIENSTAAEATYYFDELFNKLESESDVQKFETALSSQNQFFEKTITDLSSDETLKCKTPGALMLTLFKVRMMASHIGMVNEKAMTFCETSQLTSDLKVRVIRGLDQNIKLAFRVQNEGLKILDRAILDSSFPSIEFTKV